MNNETLKTLNKNNVILGKDFFISNKRNNYRNIFDVKTQNAIIMVNNERATVNEVSDFSDYISKIIDEGKTKIIIDFENVYFMDSIFFGTLVKYLKIINKKSGYIKLIVDFKSKPQLLSLSTFEGIFEIYPNLFDALNTSYN